VKRLLSAAGVLLSLCVATLLLFAGSNHAYAQEVTATLTGTITDQSGAAIPGATVTATSVERGTTYSAVTNNLGLYRISQLPVGDYTLKAEKAGFRTTYRPALTLALNQVALIDMQMQVGEQQQSVEVSSAPPLLQTETTQVDTIINSATNNALPLATRNYVELTLLSPGSVHPDPSTFNNGNNVEAGGRPYINGNREQANNFLLDGLDNNEVSDNLLGYTPAPDAIQEFNLITNNAPAEFGNFMGGIVSVTTKSGTNEYHGDIWEYFRNDVLNANEWGNKINPAVPPLARPGLRWNMFGATFGGPILKNKLFFFVDYQGQRFDHPSSAQFISVYTPAEQAGNFSQLLAQGIQLYNPCTPGTGVSGVACVAATKRAPFTGDQIPVAMISPVAAALFASPLYPKTVTNALTNNSINTVVQAFDADQGDARVDYKPSDKDQIFGRFTRGMQVDPFSNSVALLGNTFATAPIWSAVGDWTRAINPELINDVRFGWNHVVLNTGTNWAPSVGALGQSLGIANSNPNGLPGLLLLGLGGGTPSAPGTGILTNLGNSVITQDFNSQVWQANENLSWTHGRHTFKFGAEYWFNIIKVFYSGNSGELGGLTFGPNFTASSATNPAPNTGQGMADFFLGLPTSFGRGVSGGVSSSWIQTSNIFAGFAQDTWRLTNQLTLDVGLRYEAHTPWIERNDRQDNFNIDTGQIQYANQNGASRALYNGVYGLKAWQPRVGFAWTPKWLDNRTVLRGAFTISSYLEGTGTNLRLPLNPPFSPAEFQQQNLGVVLPSTTLSQGIIAPPPPSLACPAYSCFAGALLRVWDQNVQPAISDQWNLTLQHQFGWNTTLQVGYVGQKGVHLMVPFDYAQLDKQPDGTILPSPFFVKNPALVAVMSPYTSGTQSNGNMMYNALQAVLQKQVSMGLQFAVNYTYSRCMSNNIGFYGSFSTLTQTATASPYWQNVYDPGAEWAPCYFDTGNLISAYAVYDLPFGRGREFGSNMNRVANAVVGGWTVSPLLIWHTGFPLALSTTATDLTGTNTRGLRPDCNGINTVYGRRPFTGPGGGIFWFDPSNYSNPVPGDFGTCAPQLGGLRGPGYYDWDISLQKNFQLTERFRVQFRSDFLNAFNSVNLTAPVTTVAQPTTGQITLAQPAREIQFALKVFF
jgi:hypothetical protein